MCDPRVADYAAVMASIKPNAARLKAAPEFKPRDLSDRTEIGPTPLGALMIAIQEFMAEKEPEVVMANLRDALVDYLHLRPVLADLLGFIAVKARQPEVRRAAEALASRSHATWIASCGRAGRGRGRPSAFFLPVLFTAQA